MEISIPKQLQESNEIKQPKKSDSISNIEISLEDLPSKGKAYPPSTRISYRPYTFGELRSISSSNKQLSVKQEYEKILDGIGTVGIKKLDLTLSDTVYLSILRRISTTPTERFTVSFKCRKCKKDNSHFKYFRELIDFEELNIPKLPMNVEFSFGKCSFKPITVGQYLDLLTMGLGLDISATLAIQVIDRPFKDIYPIIAECSDKRDIELLEEVEKLLHHDQNPAVLHCSCGEPREVSLEGGEGCSLLPFRGDEENTRDPITFG